MIERRWFRYNDLTICAPPKCGGTALYCATLGIDPKHGNNVFSIARKRVGFMTPQEARDTGLPMLMAVRDPVDRFASLWRNKCRDGDPHLPKLRGLSPGALLRLVRGNPLGNGHWAPQVTWWVRGVETVPFRDMIARLGLPSRVVNRTTSSRADARIPTVMVRRHYWRDVALWEKTSR